MVEPTATAGRAYEKQLIDRCRAGERDALRELIDQHKDRLFAFVWRMVHQHHDAEEICQDAFLKAFASLDSFSCEYRFSTWLFTIADRVCLNHLRRRRALTGDLDFATLRSESQQASDSALESEEAGRLKELVWTAVERLSPPQRASILLFYRHELTCHEIARVLDLPLATVKSHLHRARNRLRQMLESVSEQDLREFCNLSGSAG